MGANRSSKMRPFLEREMRHRGGSIVAMGLAFSIAVLAGVGL